MRGHGTWLREAVVHGLVDAAQVVQVCIRLPAPHDAPHLIAERGGLTTDARALRGLESAEQLAPWLARARDRMRGDAPLYLTLDIEALDPSFAPGTGTPEPAGLSSRQLATWLEELADLPFVGMDLVEVSPPTTMPN